jgi:hypothetical protein
MGRTSNTLPTRIFCCPLKLTPVAALTVLSIPRSADEGDVDVDISADFCAFAVSDGMPDDILLASLGREVDRDVERQLIDRYFGDMRSEVRIKIAVGIVEETLRVKWKGTRRLGRRVIEVCRSGIILLTMSASRLCEILWMSRKGC